MPNATTPAMHRLMAFTQAPFDILAELERQQLIEQAETLYINC